MKYIIDNKRMTGFTNAEEAAVGLTAVVPFSLEVTVPTDDCAKSQVRGLRHPTLLV